MADFLLEIGVEEIPDWMILDALESLRTGFSQLAGGLNGGIELLDATPRRLVLIAKGLSDQLPDTQQVLQGPYLSAGPKAAEGFAKKNGVSVDQLQRETDAKGERYFFTVHKKGEPAAGLLTRIVPTLITSIPWPKSMYWSGKDLRFIRPIRWLVALLNDQVLPVKIGDVVAGNATRGHRILGSKSPIPVTVATYESTLRENRVIVRAAERSNRIKAGLASDVEPDSELLTTLVYLTEFPTPIRGSFDESYLSLPREILSTVMRHHQRYLSVLNADRTGLASAFVAVTNTDGDPDGLIRQGNERVLRARFNDAQFFWQVDQQRPLRDRIEDLAKVTFQAKLGTYKDKTDRVVHLARELAREIHHPVLHVERAALLCKCDLTTEMVKEFTELQGVVGGLYAKVQHEHEDVATAIYDHYRPTGMEDSIPRRVDGQLLSIADKLDTLRECFRIGLIPSGSKDPFALRRAAQGLVKILFEAKLPLHFAHLVGGVSQLGEFLLDRIQFYLREIAGFAYDEVNAVLATPPTTLADIYDRVSAVHDVRSTADFEPLAASFKRIKNILRQAGVGTGSPVQEGLLVPGPERELYTRWNAAREEVAKTESYGGKLTAIASLRLQVDLFFDKILVNDPDPRIRQNRLALLHGLLTEFSTIADFSEIVTQGVAA